MPSISFDSKKSRYNMSQQQKRKYIKQLLTTSPSFSNREIAKQLRVDHKTVGEVRRRLEDSGEIPHFKDRHKTPVPISTPDLPQLDIVPNSLYNIDCAQGIELLKQSRIKVDCLITSVPYNAKIPYADYKDNKPYKKYIGWLKNIFMDCQDIMKIGGTVAINCGDGKNGREPIHSDIIQFMTRELDYVMVTTIIWNKNTTTSRKSWGSWMKPSSPSFPTPFEYILIFRYKDSHYKKQGGKSTVSRDEYIQNSLALWTIKPETKMSKLHPAPFPEELPRRIIQQMTYENDLVLDIFSGTATTALAAKKLNRRYIGFELSEKYHQIAVDRLRAVDNNSNIGMAA